MEKEDRFEEIVDKIAAAGDDRSAVKNALLGDLEKSGELSDFKKWNLGRIADLGQERIQIEKKLLELEIASAISRLKKLQREMGFKTDGISDLSK